MRLVEEALSSDLTPEEVCADHPELLVQVRDQWLRCRLIDAQLSEVFPSAGNSLVPVPFSSADLPSIEGYDVERVLGRGGMGIVYQARHLKLNRLVALKMVLAGTFSTHMDRVRFLREAEAIAALRHEHIVQIYDLGDFQGRPFLRWNSSKVEISLRSSPVRRNRRDPRRPWLRHWQIPCISLTKKESFIAT
ncbi:MAG: tetratricopeptide repeat protein kinase family protein [Schlesneria sp.]|nr:tetratricopeptide repeat protein kinase family protein [Schlesneria sp.]